MERARSEIEEWDGPARLTGARESAEECTNGAEEGKGVGWETSPRWYRRWKARVGSEGWGVGFVPRPSGQAAAASSAPAISGRGFNTGFSFSVRAKVYPLA